MVSSLFEYCKKDLAIGIMKADSMLNVTLSNCTFLSNDAGAIGLYNQNQNTLAQLQITETLFQNTGRVDGRVGSSALDVKNTLLILKNRTTMPSLEQFLLSFLL